MDFSEHVIISAAGSTAILAGGGSMAEAAAFSATGIFIDLDHFADYWRETGVNFDIPRFLGYFEGRHPRRLLLFLHAWEWVILLSLSNFALGPLAWVTWAINGWAVHLLLDQRFNRLHPFAYSIVFRYRRRFLADSLYGDQ